MKNESLRNFRKFYTSDKRAVKNARVPHWAHKHTFWIGQKVRILFVHTMALIELSLIHLKQSILLRLYCDSCYINVHLKKYYQNW